MNFYYDNDKLILYQTINNSKMRELSRKYNSCNRTCVFPLQCTFGLSPIFYKVIGNFQVSSNGIYNTILTFTQDIIIQLFIKTKLYVTIALQSNPSVIIDSFELVAEPGSYTTPAGTAGIVVIVYINFPRC